MGWGGKEVGAYELGAWIGGERELTFKGVRLVDSDQEKKGLMLEDWWLGLAGAKGASAYVCKDWWNWVLKKGSWISGMRLGGLMWERMGGKGSLK